MSQNAQLLEMLRRGPVTPLDALNTIGCMRPAARCYELRRSGHNIVTRMIEANGKHFAEYSLGAEQ